VRPEGRTEIAGFLNLSSVVCKAIAAVYRAIFPGLERNFARSAARSANRIEHFTFTGGFTSGVLACIPARLTALRLICKAFLSKKFLLAGSEYKFGSAVFAN
jgi:hypothetical protein